MKTYIVYVNGVQMSALVKAASLNLAEMKAKKLYPSDNVWVEYTEI